MIEKTEIETTEDEEVEVNWLSSTEKNIDITIKTIYTNKQKRKTSINRSLLRIKFQYAQWICALVSNDKNSCFNCFIFRLRPAAADSLTSRDFCRLVITVSTLNCEAVVILSGSTYTMTCDDVTEGSTRHPWVLPIKVAKMFLISIPFSFVKYDGCFLVAPYVLAAVEGTWLGISFTNRKYQAYMQQYLLNSQHMKQHMTLSYILPQCILPLHVLQSQQSCN